MHGADSSCSFNNFNTMLDIKGNVKTLQIINWHILSTRLVYKCVKKGVKTKLFPLECRLPSNHQNT